jgi:hypothetical protein
LLFATFFFILNQVLGLAMLLFRSMKENREGFSEIGPSTRTLGVRPGIDVPARISTDIVRPDQGGLSVSPDDPINLPYFRRPAEFDGSGKDPVWSILDDELGTVLSYRPDSESPNTHGLIEPSRPMTLKEYQEALANTQTRWKKW